MSAGVAEAQALADPTYIALPWSSVAVAAVLVLADAAIAFALSLGIARRLLVAAVRMVVQLSLIGLLLTWLFALVSPWLTAVLVLAMTLFAGREVMARQDRRLRGALWSFGLGTGAMLFAGMIVTVLALTTQIRPDPWYDPRYAIPLLGMILGNAMTGISLGLNALTMAVARERAAIEAQLALGADRWTALRPQTRQALRSGLMPVINAMSATGIVYLPGMMTGQILAGVPPQDAVKYQLLVFFLIAGATGLGVLIAVGGGLLRLTDSRHRLRLDRLAAPPADAGR